MRTAGTFASTQIVAAAPLREQVQTREHSPWHSPVPYLFGGLAAMLGLIAFALLILACSYWKLSGHLDNGDAERDPEAGTSPDDAKTNDNLKPPAVNFLVIMAGQDKPTFLATPTFGDRSSCEGEKREKDVELSEKPKEESDGGGSGGVGGDAQVQGGDHAAP
ncbi:hypothetical protein Ancab_017796 [Ancistrocladus abbreviatus]